MSRGSTNTPDALKRRYATALKKYLAKDAGTGLRAAEALGREAVTAGISTAALATLHKHALMTLVPPGATPRTTNGKIARASTFFVAALRPLDKTHGAMRVKNGHLTRLRDSMRRSTLELARARRQLKRESARRKRLEASLSDSKRQHAQLLKESLRAQEHLRLLSHQVLSAQEEERKRISRELHDQVGQILTAVNVRLATLTTQANINANAFKRTIRSTQRLVEKSMKTVHRFARDLRPPLLDDLGLIPALKAHLDAFTRQTEIPVRFRVFAAVETLDSEKRTALYRVAQEAVANIAAHAQASLVSIVIRKDEDLVRMDIHDNGRGFDVKRRLGARRVTRLGLLGMRERLEMVGGSFDVEAEPGNGTTIHAQIPFSGHRRSRRAQSRVLRKTRTIHK
jgi:signal transduction histidine kinase